MTKRRRGNSRNLPRQEEVGLDVAADGSIHSGSKHLGDLTEITMRDAVEAVLDYRHHEEKVVHGNVYYRRTLTDLDAATVLKRPGILSEFVPSPCFFNNSGLPGETVVHRGDLIIWEASFQYTHKLKQLCSKDEGFGYVAKHPQILGIQLPRLVRKLCLGRWKWHRGRFGRVRWYRGRFGRWRWHLDHYDRSWVLRKRRCFVIFLFNGQDTQGNKWGEKENEMTFLNRRNTAFVWASGLTIGQWGVKKVKEAKDAEIAAEIAAKDAEIAAKDAEIAILREQLQAQQ